MTFLINSLTAENIIKEWRKNLMTDKALMVKTYNYWTSRLTNSLQAPKTHHTEEALFSNHVKTRLGWRT